MPAPRPGSQTAAGGLIAALRRIYERDLNALRREVEAYPEDHQLWQIVPGFPNTGGTLTLHLAGNLQHYVGSRLAGTGYVRNRDAEFSLRNVPRTQLLTEIEAARQAVRAGLASISDERLAEEFPEVIAGSRFLIGEYLVHLTTHFAFHLGQLDSHRRLVTGVAQSIGPVRPQELSSARGAETRQPSA
jgi:hypothetical protein